MSGISTVKQRDGLAPRRAPYWHRIRAGCYVGFRRMSGASEGAWSARFRDEEGRQTFQALGTFDDRPPSERFDAAVRAAETWFTHRDRGGSRSTPTVEEACENYVQHLRDAGRESTARDAEARFARWITPDRKLARTPLTKLTARQLTKWRATLAATPATPQDREKEATRPRSPATMNRDMSAVKAAMNLALDLGDVTTDQAWRVALRPIPGASGRRDLYLSLDERRRLVESASEEAQPFLRALSLLPLRVGAVAALRVADLDRKQGVLTVRHDKAGGGRRIALPTATVAFLAEQARRKLPGAPLLARADGGAWDRHAWKIAIRAAADVAGLPARTCAYTLRHSTITDLVRSGVPTLTVAQLSGTSVMMVQRFYGHLQREDAAEALGRLAL